MIFRLLLCSLRIIVLLWVLYGINVTGLGKSGGPVDDDGVWFEQRMVQRVVTLLINYFLNHDLDFYKAHSSVPLHTRDSIITARQLSEVFSSGSSLWAHYRDVCLPARIAMLDVVGARKIGAFFILRRTFVCGKAKKQALSNISTRPELLARYHAGVLGSEHSWSTRGPSASRHEPRA